MYFCSHGYNRSFNPSKIKYKGCIDPSQIKNRLEFKKKKICSLGK